MNQPFNSTRLMHSILQYRWSYQLEILKNPLVKNPYFHLYTRESLSTRIGNTPAIETYFSTLNMNGKAMATLHLLCSFFFFALFYCLINISPL